MKIPSLIVGLTATVILSGCISTGTRFNASKTSDIKPQITTLSDLQLWFGKPWSERPQKDGSTRYVWQFTKGGFAVGVGEQQVLTVSVGPDGRVKEFGFKQK